MTKLPLPPLRRVPQALKKELEEYRKANPTPRSPCIDQTEAEIEAYYRTVPLGMNAVVRNTQGHGLVYHLAEVEGTNPARGRVYVKGHGAFYMKHGKNCYHPTGQVSLVVPTQEVLQWTKEHPRGEMGYTIFR